MEKIKDAFRKVKEDLDFLENKLDNFEVILKDLRQDIDLILEKQEKILSTHKAEIQTPSTHTSTHNTASEPLKPQNMPISIGNQGVPTDRQTDRQTHQQTDLEENSFENASKILDSLDNIKKGIRLKFKRLTDQELLIFSTIYQLEEEQEHIDYKTISNKLSLSESSIRDYVGRLIKKGIPVDKKKINNKQIKLSISQDLRKIASLSTILKLREL